MTERWLPVVGFEGVYSVSDRGRVRRDLACRGAVSGLVLSPGSKQSGHLVVKLYPGNLNRRPRMRMIHQLVLEAFVGPAPRGCETSHLNGIPTDNSLKNLAWETHSENMARASRHEATCRGGRQPGAKLNEQAVRVLRHLYGKRPLWLLSRLHGVNHATALSAIARRTWRHVA